MNELLQWLAIAATFLLVFGLYWRHAQSLVNSVGDISLRSGPRLGRVLPRLALEKVRDALGSIERATVLAFVTEACVGCQRLLDEIESKWPQSQDRNWNLVLVSAAQASPAFEDALRQLPVPTVLDDGNLWRVCDVQATPFLVALDKEGVVTGKTVDHTLAGIRDTFWPATISDRRTG